ncbi:hypothetical protein KKA15_04895 [Patescibacteria group bacterium]|nr:hypothetical protein [Patescibacteria group bacterium]
MNVICSIIPILTLIVLAASLLFSIKRIVKIKTKDYIKFLLCILVVILIGVAGSFIFLYLTVQVCGAPML